MTDPDEAVALVQSYRDDGHCLPATSDHLSSGNPGAIQSGIRHHPVELDDTRRTLIGVGDRPSSEKPWRRGVGQPLFNILGVTVVLALGSDPAVVGPRLAEEWSEQTATVSEVPQVETELLEVLYEVEGTARTAFVTMETPTGSEQSLAPLPMRNESGSTGVRIHVNNGDFVSLSAQDQIRGDSGTVTCRITVNGKVISENTASGLYATASCQGNA